MGFHSSVIIYLRGLFTMTLSLHYKTNFNQIHIDVSSSIDRVRL